MRKRMFFKTEAEARNTKKEIEAIIVEHKISRLWPILEHGNRKFDIVKSGKIVERFGHWILTLGVIEQSTN